MKILSVTQLAFPEVKVVKYARFNDNRGYFTEPYRKSDFFGHPDMGFMKGVDFLQVNESASQKNVIRGLHFQWNPYMGKLVRTVTGHMADMIMDIRLGSPNFGKIIVHDMPTRFEDDVNEWIWVPVGFAHGNFYFEETKIEYFCSSEYSPGCEAGISPLSQDIDWSMCDANMKTAFDAIVAEGAIVSEKDQKGFSLESWKADERSKEFVYR